MATQVSKTQANIDVAAQKRVLAEQTKAAQMKKQETVDTSAPERVAEETGRPDFLAVEETAKEKVQAAEKRSLELERVDKATLDSQKTQKEVVLETYNMASVFGQIAESKARRAELAEERQVRVENDQRLDGERQAARARFEKTEQAAIEAKSAKQAQLQQLADDRKAEAASASDLSAIAEILGVSSDAEVIMLELQRDLDDAAAFVATEDEAKAKKAAQAVVAAEQKLKEALADQGARRRQLDLNRRDAAAKVRKDDLTEVPVVPKSTLSIVPSPRVEPEVQSESAREPVIENKPTLLDPRDIRLGSEAEKQATKRAIDSAQALTATVDESVAQLAQEAKQRSRDILDKVSLRTAVPRLADATEATKVAEEAAQAIAETPVQAVQTQAAFDIDTVLRVLR
ncbi:MAG: hypothetical protein ACON3Z_14275 [Bradymonadia bacterium]